MRSLSKGWPRGSLVGAQFPLRISGPLDAMLSGRSWRRSHQGTNDFPQISHGAFDPLGPGIAAVQADKILEPRLRRKNRSRCGTNPGRHSSLIDGQSINVRWQLDPETHAAG